MDYKETAKSIKNLHLSADIIDSLYHCISAFWQGNYYRTSEDTQNCVTVLKNKLDKKKNLTSIDIEHLLWLLDRYGYQDEINSILGYSDYEVEIPTSYGEIEEED